jgi:hypothetical protein
MASKGKYDVKISDLKKGIVTNKNVRLAIVQQAILYWNKLPQHTRSWFTLSDMIAEGVNHVVMQIAKKYKSELSKVITYVVHCVRNHYINVVKYFMAEERKDSRTVSLSSPLTADGMTLFDTLVATASTGSLENCVISRIDAITAFMKVYGAADESTRKYIIKWLLQPKFSRNKVGEHFTEAVHQFKFLAAHFGLTYELCSSILSDIDLRTSLSFKLIHKFRTPKRTTSSATLRESIEGDLVPLVMPYAYQT